MNTALVPTVRFEAGILPPRSAGDGQFLSPGDPAILAITDFSREHPVTVDVERQIDDALSDMIVLGVRALLVLEEQHIVGLITSYDIQGERPLQFLQSSNYRHHRDIRVADIMTPWDALTAIDWESIQSMSAGELLKMLEEARLTHVLVVEVAGRNSCIIRALVSRARLVRQLTGFHAARYK
jgi:CBS-domain-containing membrane protein